MSSFGEQETTSRVMISPIFDWAGSPPATSRMARSRSVMVPITFFDSSQIGRKPTFSSSISRAADCAVSSGETQATSRFMISSQSIVSCWFLAMTASGPRAAAAQRADRYALGVSRRAVSLPLCPADVHLHDEEALLCQLQSRLGGEVSGRAPAVRDQL